MYPFFFAILYHQPVNIGVKIAVVIVDATTCGVATETIPAIDGSISATSAGIATALPAVLDTAAPGILSIVFWLEFAFLHSPY